MNHSSVQIIEKRFKILIDSNVNQKHLEIIQVSLGRVEPKHLQSCF